MAIFATSVSGNGVRALLAEHDDLFVAKGVTVASDNGQAVVSIGATSSDHHAIVEGNVVSQTEGLVLGLGLSDHDQILTVKAGAQIIGFDAGGAAVFGANSVVNNAGLIFGDHDGLSFGVGKGAGSSLTNSGTIEGGSFGIINANDSGQVLSIKNSGTVKGGISSFQEALTGGDRIVNTGSMIGNILFNEGKDTYDGRLGHVNGTVFGFNGGDKLFGGSENNRLSSGEGNDKLLGGLGSDTFIFDARLNKDTNVDTIGDFVHGNDKIQIDHSIFAGLAAGALSESAFKDTGVPGSKVDGTDRILYNHTTGYLYYDQDGSHTTTGAVKFAHLDGHVALSASDFIVT